MIRKKLQGDVLAMNMKSLLTPLVLTASIGLTGLLTPSALANNVPTQAPTQNVQSQTVIEHMREMRIDSRSVTIYEEWFNPASKIIRADTHYINSGVVKSDSFQQKDEESLFKRMIKSYQDKDVWKPFATVEIEGKKVEKRKAILSPKGDPAYQIAYVDLSTGLPIKEEHYNSNNQVMNTFVFYFDHINDPNGDIFKTQK